MQIARRFTTESRDQYENVRFRAPSSEIRNPDGSVVFSAENVGVPPWLWRRRADTEALAALPKAERSGAESSAKQCFDRLAGTWTWWGWQGGYFDSEGDARAFYDEIRVMLAR